MPLDSKKKPDAAPAKVDAKEKAAKEEGSKKKDLVKGAEGHAAQEKKLAPDAAKDKKKA